MRWLRDWLGWAAAWTLVAQAPMWVWVGLDVLEERHDVTLDASPVGAVAAARRRGDLLALSAAAALALGPTALWHKSTWGSVMR